MNVAFGHTNMDLDCLGSLILVKKLFPDYKIVRSKLIHPAARHLYNLYLGYFDFINPNDMEGESIDNIIIVDTCMAERVSEYFSYIRNSDPKIRVFDHHQIEKCNIFGAQVEGGHYGANTSYLGKLAIEQGINLASEEATIALTGIYADTGRLIYENVSPVDYEVSAWLLGMGASLRQVKSSLETVKEEDQVEILNRILLTRNTVVIQGHNILTSYIELEKNIPGLAEVVERVMDIQSPDAYFAFFSITNKKTVLLIARSQKKRIDLHELLHVYGGGGHQLAASAKIQNREGNEFYDEFLQYLEKSLSPATRAADIMTRDVYTINENESLVEASMVLEKMDHTGVPVLNDSGAVTGFISLRDIMKGRKASLMKAPVKAFMTHPAITASSSITMREVERLFFKHQIGHLPIVEDNKLMGIVTRRDYLLYQKGTSSAGST